MTLSLRIAQADDIPFVARILTEVSEGIVETLLENAVPGASAEALLEIALGKNTEPYHLDNIVLADYEGKTIGLLFAYPAQLQRVPVIMERFLAKERIDAVRDLMEAQAEKALWINTFWVAPVFRGEGLSSVLMNAAGTMARDSGLTSLALHCWGDNARALAFYRKCGFEVKRDVLFGEALTRRHGGAGKLLVKEL